MEPTTSILIENVQSKESMVYIEPWGEQYSLKPKATIQVYADGPAGGSLHLQFSADSLWIWGWAGSVVEVYQDGHELGPGASGRPRVPIAKQE